MKKKRLINLPESHLSKIFDKKNLYKLMMIIYMSKYEKKHHVTLIILN